MSADPTVKSTRGLRVADRVEADIQDALPHIEAMGFDKRFQRLWTYYLAYCEGGFRAGILDVGLYTIGHPEPSR